MRVRSLPSHSPTDRLHHLAGLIKVVSSEVWSWGRVALVAFCWGVVFPIVARTLLRCAALRCTARLVHSATMLPRREAVLVACPHVVAVSPTLLTQQFLVAGWCETGWTWQVFFGEWTLPWEHDDPFTRLGWDCAQGICIGGVAFCISMSTCIWICMCLRFTFVIAILWGLAIAHIPELAH